MKKMQIDKLNAIVFEDEYGITMVYNGNGGAVVSGNNFENVKDKFISGMELSEAVGKVLKLEHKRLNGENG